MSDIGKRLEKAKEALKAANLSGNKLQLEIAKQLYNDASDELYALPYVTHKARRSVNPRRIMYNTNQIAVVGFIADWSWRWETETWGAIVEAVYRRIKVNGELFAETSTQYIFGWGRDTDDAFVVCLKDDVEATRPKYVPVV